MENDNVFKVKISGCVDKELPIKQKKIMLKDISILAGIDDNTSYTINGKIHNPQTEITLYDGIELVCDTLGGGS